jgi:hypothetical protein
VEGFFSNAMGYLLNGYHEFYWMGLRTNIWPEFYWNDMTTDIKNYEHW